MSIIHGNLKAVCVSSVTTTDHNTNVFQGKCGYGRPGGATNYRFCACQGMLHQGTFIYIDKFHSQIEGGLLTQSRALNQRGRWQPPEMFEDDVEMTARSDIYSFAMTVLQV